MLSEERLRSLPHLWREHMARLGLNEEAELVGRSGGLVGSGDRLDTRSDLLDWRAAVGLAEVQVQRAGGDQRGDIGRVAVRQQSRNKVREAVQQPLAVDAAYVGRQQFPTRHFSRGSQGPTSHVCVEPMECP